MFIIRNKKFFFVLSGFLIALSLLLIFTKGLSFGIDFTGGSILEVEYEGKRPEIISVKEKLDALALGAYRLQPLGEKSFILRTRELNQTEKETALKIFSAVGPEGRVAEKRFNTVGPVIGEELKQKAFVAILIVVTAIILFIAFSFRKVSKPVSSWKYGLVAIVALVHDIVIPTGFFVLLHILSGVEIDILFVTALLAILGFSVNDTIVVFDRIRENLNSNQERKIEEDFEKTVGRSLSQTFSRSVNTSLTTLLVLLSLFFLGGTATRYFALALVIGVIFGTYSSIFLASPLLVWLAPTPVSEK
ncbi:protein translocase subunit SecF [Candidatus Campbellbacteria bacterium CG22_combo_CG10-13_8_21_14_all_43_18]|uniref:Protein-export membrane protein SecF n=1 Tax=Candidatus Campbellbacteria bacterium CG22_combo_CG10-13_8_21_14_all_43_18 TaxID=1974530 RepID=A0A2H0DXG6_9BACT|nr:MAG: protein translocase subunit SecF [Candidatus Campbellbacteria bacterium CG22_combo_CG10-13_8_21_14_all_43_18]